MIDCKKLNITIKCNWFKRWQKEINTPDLPVMVTMKGDTTDLERLTLTQLERENNPCSDGIVTAWKTFLQQFFFTHIFQNIDTKSIRVVLIIDRDRLHLFSLIIFKRGRFFFLKNTLELYVFRHHPQSSYS